MDGTGPECKAIVWVRGDVSHSASTMFCRCLKLSPHPLHPSATTLIQPDPLIRLPKVEQSAAYTGGCSVQYRTPIPAAWAGGSRGRWGGGVGKFVFRVLEHFLTLNSLFHSVQLNMHKLGGTMPLYHSPQMGENEIMGDNRGRNFVPRSTEAKNIFRAPLKPNFVPHCRPLVWVGGSQRGGGGRGRWGSSEHSKSANPHRCSTILIHARLWQRLLTNPLMQHLKWDTFSRRSVLQGACCNAMRCHFLTVLPSSKAPHVRPPWLQPLTPSFSELHIET